MARQMPHQRTLTRIETKRLELSSFGCGPGSRHGGVHNNFPMARPHQLHCFLRVNATRPGVASGAEPVVLLVRFVSFRFVSFRFVLFCFVSLCFALFRFVFAFVVFCVVLCCFVFFCVDLCLFVCLFV